MPSANDTAVFTNGGTITDAYGDVWTLVNGQVEVNGVIDPTTANVIEMAYVNGVVWQENADFLWWGKSNPSAAWSPPNGTSVSPLPASTNPVSENDTAVFLPGQTITDASGNTWSIGSNGHVLINGAADPSTANVIELAYVNGKVWQENADYEWWAKTSPSANWSGGTTVSPLPVPGNAVSANNTVAYLPGETITDASHNNWTISNDGQVLINGAADPTTANVIELAYENGEVWQENASGLWWEKSSPSASWRGGTSVSPVPAGSIPTLAPANTLTWVGGGSDSAADTADWSPVASPAPGDTLQIVNTAAINVSGNDLAGATLTVATDNYADPVDVTTSHSAQLSLQDNFSSALLTALDPTTVTIGSIHGDLTARGAALQFVGNSSLNGSASFNLNLTGNGQIALTGGQGEGSEVALNGSVGSGLTFDMLASAPVLTLNINEPGQFAGTLNVPEAGSFGAVVFGGLQATGGELMNGMLDLYNGSTLIDSTRVTGSTASLTLDQTSVGVVLSQNHTFSGNYTGVTALPLTT